MDYKVDSEDIHFTLFDFLNVNQLTELPRFQGQTSDMYTSMIEEGLKPGETELSIFYKYVLQKPFSTVIAAVAAIGVAEGLAVTAVGASPAHILLSAITAGFASNSLANRPGESPA